MPNAREGTLCRPDERHKYESRKCNLIDPMIGSSVLLARGAYDLILYAFAPLDYGDMKVCRLSSSLLKSSV